MQPLKEAQQKSGSNDLCWSISVCFNDLSFYSFIFIFISFWPSSYKTNTTNITEICTDTISINLIVEKPIRVAMCRTSSLMTEKQIELDFLRVIGK